MILFLLLLAGGLAGAAVWRWWTRLNNDLATACRLTNMEVPG